MPAYFNENDKYAASWLRNLIAAGHIAPGDVDERDIRDVRPSDLAGYTQCHFFAGIGVWSYGLRRAGWPGDRPVWTGSCPCQPFSQAGRGAGFADERHLWPAFHHLIAQCRPDVVFGEQVASKNGLAWLDLVQADMEATGYAFGAVDTCAASVGAPHIRQRLYWVANNNNSGRQWRRPGEASDGRDAPWLEPERLRDAGLVVDADHEGPQGRRVLPKRPDQRAPGARGVAGELGNAERIGTGRDTGAGVGAQGGTSLRSVGDDAGSPGAVRQLADADGGHAGAEGQQCSGEQRLVTPYRGVVERLERPGPVNGVWRDADWLLCRDGKWRPVRPGTFPLAHGASARVGRLRAYGNAVVAPQVEEFVKAYLEATQLLGVME